MQVNIRAVDDLKRLNNTLISFLKWIEFKLFLDILRGKIYSNGNKDERIANETKTSNNCH